MSRETVVIARTLERAVNQLLDLHNEEVREQIQLVPWSCEFSTAGLSIKHAGNATRKNAFQLVEQLFDGFVAMSTQVAGQGPGIAPLNATES